MTSEKMNQLIPQRKERSIWSLYSPARLSRITLPNQPNSMYAMIRAPIQNMIQEQVVLSPWLPFTMMAAAPYRVTPRPTVATMGHLLCSGT